MSSVPVPFPQPPYTIESYPLEYPQQFTSVTNGGFDEGEFGQGGFGIGTGGVTLMGVINGINATFTTGVNFRKVQVFRNGIAMTQNVDYAWGSNVVTFKGNNIPQPGDVLTVVGWPF